MHTCLTAQILANEPRRVSCAHICGVKNQAQNRFREKRDASENNYIFSPPMLHTSPLRLPCNDKVYVQ